MADDKLIEKIEAWLSGDLPTDEAKEFEAQMLGDPALAEEVELHRLTLQAMHRLSENDLKEKVSDWLDNLPMERPSDNPSPPVISIPWKTWLWISLVGLLLLSAGVFGIYRWGKSKEESKTAEIEALKLQLEDRKREILELQQKPVPPSVNIDSLKREFSQLQQRINELEGKKQGPTAGVNTYYEPPYLSKMRGEKNTIDSLYDEAVDAFGVDEFNKSASLCKAILDIQPDNTKTTRLLAYSYFKLNRYVEALEAFRGIANVVSYKGEAEWHIMLCHKALSAVDTGQREVYLAELKRLADEGDAKFKPKAKKLLQQELSRNKKN